MRKHMNAIIDGIITRTHPTPTPTPTPTPNPIADGMRTFQDALTTK